MLLGREAECARLDALLTDAQKGNSGVLVIRGEPGIGKTALVRYAADQAAPRGTKTLTARGLDSESELPFAALADLTRPIRATLPSIPDTQRAVLAGALALGPPVPGDRFATCAATLSLLAAAAEQAPILCLVDDVQWLDASSAEALLFAARRLGLEGIAMIFTLREGESGRVTIDDLPTLALQGLEQNASMKLLTQGEHPVSSSVAAQLHRALHGNPLALMEVPPLLTEAERSGLEPLPDPLPAGARLEQAFLRRLRALPSSSQLALLVSAASESGDLATIHRALSQLSVTADALAPAESTGLIAIDGALLRFRHPLIRSAIYQSADPVARRQAHAALADALNAEEVADRRAWHLAAAATAPDETIAAGLETAAVHSTARTGYASAAKALARAAGLTPARADRARRLLAAANAYQLIGLPAEAMRLLDEAAACEPGEDAWLTIEMLRAEIESWTGKPKAAYARMLREAERHADREPVRAAVMLAQAAVPCFMAGEIRKALDACQRALAFATGAGCEVPLLVNVLLAEALVLSGEGESAMPYIDESLRRISTSGPEAARQAQYLPFSMVAVERYDEARALMEAAVGAARQASAAAILPYGLATLSEIECKTGNFAAAYAHGTESVRLAQETGQDSGASFSFVTLARVEAAQGREADCRAHVAAAEALAKEFGVHSIFHYSNAALGLLELGLGQLPRAIAHFRECDRLARINGLREPTLIQWQGDYIESLARAGQLDEAREALCALEADARRTGRIWAQAVAEWCRGYLSDDDPDSHFRRALELHDRRPSAFEIARTRLCYGEVLRRNRRRIEARDQLNLALDVFEQVGAEPWASRARAELAASGEKARKRDASGSRDLTPQELQIALLVTQGATNREAAAQLFLSPKTVEAHLSSAYRKLDIRSRTHLVRLFASEPALTK